MGIDEDADQNLALYSPADTHCTFANSENPVEMLHNAVFNQILYCLLGKDRSSEREVG